MTELFDRWITDDSPVLIDPLTGYLLKCMFGGSYGNCENTKCFGNVISMEPDGGLYPCGKGCSKRFLLKNITEADNLNEILNTPAMASFIQEYSKYIQGCHYCDYIDICNGGCAINIIAEHTQVSNTPMCEYYKRIFGHIRSFLDDIMSKKLNPDTINPALRETIIRWMVDPQRYTFKD